jgi:acyl-CoA dehydrogenase
MMEFELSNEERIFLDTLSNILEKELKPIAKEIDSNRKEIYGVFKKLGDHGFLGLLNSEKYGGANASMKIAVLAAEQIGKNDPSLATAVLFLLNTAWSTIVEKYGKEEVAEEYITKMAKGEAFIGICSTEPTGGSDVASIRTVAKKENENYYISGEKIYISGVKEILETDGGLVTLAKTDIEKGSKGISALFIPLKKVSGFEFFKIENMGRMGVSTSILKFNNLEINQKYLLGEENKGFYYAMEGFTTARIMVAASCIGAAEAVLELGIDYIKKREAFGKPIAKYEGIQFPLSDLYTKLEAAKLLVLKAAHVYDSMKKNQASKSEVAKYSAMSKLLAPQIGIEIISEVMKWLGAYGYTKDAGVEMALRGMFSYYVGAEGTPNIMRIIIAREILGREFLPYRD